MKCGEERPSCLKCTSTGRTCDGYEFPPDVESSSSINPSAMVIRLATSPSSNIVGNDREQRSFHFFRHTTVTQLSGFFGEDMWDRLVLQTSHFEPAIRHAVIALGSLHERFVGHSGLISQRDSLDNFALQQYNLAIRSLMEPVSRKKRPSTDVCLVACTLFACFEVGLSNGALIFQPNLATTSILWFWSTNASYHESSR